MLAYRAVSHAYGTREVLHDVTLAVERGERVALLGPSGAGKTTLFRLAYAAFAPTSGSVYLDGTDLQGVRGAALRAARARIAVVFQQHGLVDQISVFANVVAGTFGRRGTFASVGAVLRPSAHDRSVVQAALEHVGLADRANDRAFDLSGGQRQRVAIARAIVQRAELVLADEPAASLDPDLAREVVDVLLRDARERGAALVCTLHQPELTRGFDRIITLEDGRVTQDRSSTLV